MKDGRMSRLDYENINRYANEGTGIIVFVEIGRRPSVGRETPNDIESRYCTPNNVFSPKLLEHFFFRIYLYFNAQ